jgi:two-component system chemotaxis response regulator CheB
MPEMDGLKTLKEIRKIHPCLPIIMFGTLTERSSEAALDALSLGANDYVTKPANIGSMPAAIQRIQEDLIPKLKVSCPHIIPPSLIPNRLGLNGAAKPVARKEELPTSPTNKTSLIEILAIGVSTGGPNALAELLPALPADFPIPIVIVQHMPPLFTKLLAERLKSKSSLKVSECIAGEPLRPGHVWLAPGGYHMFVEREAGQVRIRTNQEPMENSCRPAVDVLFRSVAKAYGAGTLAVVLTGMGQDGLRGCEMIHAAGGQVLAQDQATSVVWGMPGYVAHAGLADRVLPLNQLAPEIMRRVRRASPLQASPGNIAEISFRRN